MLEILWRVTIGAWITAGAIIFLRLLFRRHLSARWKYALWLLLLVRLLLPVLPESPTSVMNLAATSKVSAPVSIVTEPEKTLDDGAATILSEQIAQTTPTRTLGTQQILGILWLSGMVLCGAVYGMMALKTALRLRHMVPITSPALQNRCQQLCRELGIHQSIRLCYGECAMIGGLIHPTMVLPRELMGKRLQVAMTHELMHCKYGDLWIMALWRLMCCIHWFDPVVWICFFWAKRDCEAACDERVLSRKDISPAAYAALLYEEASMKHPNQVGATALGGGGLKSRIRSIAAYRKPRIGGTILVLALCLLITACTMTGPITSQKNEALDGGQPSQSLFLHALCQQTEGLRYQPEDHDYFWRVMGCYASTQDMNMDNGEIELSPEQVLAMAQTAFPSLEITDTQLLPGIPGYILEDGTAPPVELLDNGNYRFARKNVAYSMETELVSTDGGQEQRTVTMKDPQGTVTSQWDVTIDQFGIIHSMKPI